MATATKKKRKPAVNANAKAPVKPKPPVTPSGVIGTQKAPELIDKIVTEEDLELNPDLKERGVNVGDTIQIPVAATEEENAATKKALEEAANKESEDAKATENKKIKTPKELTKEELKIHERMAPYLAAYPDEKKFFITEDGSVFLSANKQDALNHQKGIAPKKEVYTYHQL